MLPSYSIDRAVSACFFIFLLLRCLPLLTYLSDAQGPFGIKHLRAACQGECDARQVGASRKNSGIEECRGKKE